MHHLSALEIHQRFLNGQFSAIDIVQHFLQRIEDFDKQIGAFLTVFQERALAQAKRIDQRLAAGESLGRLAAIPIAIKDNIHIKGEKTTCSSHFLSNYQAIFDASVVQLLEQEDAILIGKTNMDEFAMGSSTEHSALGQTRNPWNLDCVPGGSSGGSAAAVAARLCPIALGSDTGGSIRQPAAFCGVLGFKPSYGRVSRYGLVAFASSLDQIGPIATCMEDIGLVMEVIGKHCEKDSTSIVKEPEEYLQSFEKSLKGKTFAVPRTFTKDLSQAARDNFEQSLASLQNLGAQLVDVDLPLLKYSVAVYYILSTAEASTNLARFDGIRYGKRSERAQSLADLYDYSKEEGFGAEVKRRILLGTFVLSAGYQDAFYKKAQKVRQRIIDDYKRVFQTADFVALPVSPTSAFKQKSIKDPLQMYLSDIYTLSANLAGLPAISIPSGFNAEKKPFGLQLIAPQLHDVSLCQAAHAFENANLYSQEIPHAYQEIKSS